MEGSPANGEVGRHLGGRGEPRDAEAVRRRAEDPQHRGSVLERLEAGVEDAAVDGRRGRQPAGRQVLVLGAPLVLDVADRDAGARGPGRDAEARAIVLEPGEVGRRLPRGDRRPAAGRRRAAEGGRGRRDGRHGRLDARARVEAAREAAGGGRAGGARPVQVAQLGKRPAGAPLEDGHVRRRQRGPRHAAEGVRGERRGRLHEDVRARRRARGAGGEGERRDGDRGRRGDGGATSGHGSRMAIRSGEANPAGKQG